jgi:hypothetical protein
MQLEHKPFLLPKSADLYSSIRPALIAQWQIENNKLVCRWIVDDRPSHLPDNSCN